MPKARTSSILFRKNPRPEIIIIGTDGQFAQKHKKYTYELRIAELDDGQNGRPFGINAKTPPKHVKKLKFRESKIDLLLFNPTLRM